MTATHDSLDIYCTHVNCKLARVKLTDSKERIKKNSSFGLGW